MKQNPMIFLYKPYPDELAAFGPAWVGPKEYEHIQESLIARYASGNDSDGQTVEVFCTAAPARFYTLRVLAGQNSIEEPQEPYEVRTGSGQAKMAAIIAEAISSGMLGFHPQGKAVKP